MKKKQRKRGTSDTRQSNLSLSDIESVIMPHRVVETFSAEIEGVAERMERDSFSGIPSGIRPIDLAIAGFEPGEFIVIAGGTGQGKSALAIQMALAMAGQGTKVLFFTVEQPVAHFTRRLVAQAANIDTANIGIAHFEEKELRFLWAEADRISGLPFRIDDTPILTIPMIERKIQALKRQNEGPAIVFIDYLQLMGEEGREREALPDLAALSRGLKSFAKEYSILVVLVTQLERRTPDPAAYTPALTDLPGNGSLERDADIVLFVQRREAAKEADHDETVLTLLKNRNGPTGAWKMLFKRSGITVYEYKGAERLTDTEN